MIRRCDVTDVSEAYLEGPEDHAKIRDVPENSNADHIGGDDTEGNRLGAVDILQVSRLEMLLLDGDGGQRGEGRIKCRRHGG